jgi:radical SAM superfamily enzyme YgiQ (UPF0313 family)
MKICIVTTPIRPQPTNYPPFGSMAIIQSLRSIGQEVSFHNIDYHRFSHEQNIEYFKKNKFDAIGISAVVSTAYAYTKYLSTLIRKLYPETIIFMGGGLAASAEITHRKANIDYCVVGDGEVIVKNLVRAIEEKKTDDEDLKKILGITFIDKKNKFNFTGYEHPLPAPLIENPDFKILEDDKSIHHYIDESGGIKYNPDKKTKRKKTATVIVAKGCVARCTFCHRFEKGYRVSPIEKIINHIKDLKEKYNVSYLRIGDENFGSYKEETNLLVKEFGKLGLQWSAAGVRAHTVDLEMLKLWKSNGCNSVLFGIESGSPTMLKVMEKKISLEQNINALKYAYEAGLGTVVQLVIGMPGETDETIEETVDFLKIVMDYYPDSFKKKLSFLISINYAQALPGTPLYEYAREKGYVGKNMEEEEDYLIRISDKDAYDNDHFINYTKQPLLKVYSWRHLINWKIWRIHVKKNLNIEISKTKIIYGILIQIFNKFFKTKINSELQTKLSQHQEHKEGNFYFNFQTKVRLIDGLRLLLPWNKYTYPFICILIAYKESMNFKWFFKLIAEHLIWNFKKFDKKDLPSLSLRKIVNISDKDDTLELRKGR